MRAPRPRPPQPGPVLPRVGGPHRPRALLPESALSPRAGPAGPGHRAGFPAARRAAPSRSVCGRRGAGAGRPGPRAARRGVPRRGGSCTHAAPRALGTRAGSLPGYAPKISLPVFKYLQKAGPGVLPGTGHGGRPPIPLLPAPGTTGRPWAPAFQNILAPLHTLQPRPHPGVVPSLRRVCTPSWRQGDTFAQWCVPPPQHPFLSPWDQATQWESGDLPSRGSDAFLGLLLWELLAPTRSRRGDTEAMEGVGPLHTPRVTACTWMGAATHPAAVGKGDPGAGVEGPR